MLFASPRGAVFNSSVCAAAKEEPLPKKKRTTQSAVLTLVDEEPEELCEEKVGVPDATIEEEEQKIGPGSFGFIGSGAFQRLQRANGA